jgi:hypothetical protein
MGSITVRVMGELEDINQFLKILEKVFGENVFVSGPFRNTRDPGYRAYATIKMPSAYAEAEEP